jgi:hypothetical protein
MKHILLVAGLASAMSMLNACGGGGSGTDAQPTLPPVAQPFAKYEGSWKTACQFHHRETYTLATSSNATQLSILDQSDYYANDDCTGAVVATGTYSQAIAKLLYASTLANATVKLQSGENISDTVDRGTSNGSASDALLSFTGSGVTSTVVNGKTVWHIAYNGGSTDVHIESVSGASPAGLLLRNGQLYFLSAQANSSTAFDASAPLVH